MEKPDKKYSKYLNASMSLEIKAQRSFLSGVKQQCKILYKEHIFLHILMAQVALLLSVESDIIKSLP